MHHKFVIRFACSVALALAASACVSRNTSPAITPEQMQENLKAAGEVRAEHARLKRFVGTWKTETSIWTDPAKAPEVSKGTANQWLIFGGRYLEQNYRGSFMGKPFEGRGLMGFDNLSNRYFSTWIDSSITSIMKSEGTAVSDNQLVFSSSQICPMSKAETTSEEVITFVDANNYRYEAFQLGADGFRSKMLEVKYRRIRG